MYTARVARLAVGLQPGASTRISPGASGSFEHGSVPVATQACVLERVFVRRQATAYLLACAHALTFWRLLVHTSRVCSVVNVNGDDGGSIKPEPHDVVLSTANALHLLASTDRPAPSSVRLTLSSSAEAMRTSSARPVDMVGRARVFRGDANGFTPQPSSRLRADHVRVQHSLGKVVV